VPDCGCTGGGCPRAPRGSDLLSGKGLDDATLCRAEALDRYERRALASRKRAIREFCAAYRPGCELARGVVQRCPELAVAEIGQTNLTLPGLDAPAAERTRPSPCIPGRANPSFALELGKTSYWAATRCSTAKGSSRTGLSA
jgi:hypothetical protein